MTLETEINERIIVQFCPCGDVLNLTKERYFEMGGSQKHLDDIEAGIKLDAPILPSSACPQCEADAEEQDRRSADRLSLKEAEMTATTILFNEGDVLTWEPSRLDDASHPKHRRGDGPFTVVAVVEVPKHCLYPDTYCSLGDHAEHCGVSIYKSVGHPQWVIIRLPNGEVPQDSVANRDSRFSGAWFARA